MDFLEKLNTLMEKNNYNKSTLSKACGIPYTTIDGWYKRGYEELRLPTIKKLCTFFNTSLDYWIKDEITDPNYGKTENFQISYEEMKHIEKYRDLDDFGKKRIDKEIDKEIERIKSIEERDQRIKELESNQPKQPANGYVILPFYPALASAGQGEFLFNDIPCQTIEVPAERAVGANFAVKVKGDSMEPVLYDGYVVCVKKQEALDIDDLGLFVIDGECFVKIFKGDHLHSLNEKYPDIPFGLYSAIYCLGKVVGAIGDDEDEDEIISEIKTDNHPIHRFVAEKGLRDTKETREMTEAIDEAFKEMLGENGKEE